MPLLFNHPDTDLLSGHSGAPHLGDFGKNASFPLARSSGGQAAPSPRPSRPRPHPPLSLTSSSRGCCGPAHAPTPAPGAHTRPRRRAFQDQGLPTPGSHRGSPLLHAAPAFSNLSKRTWPPDPGSVSPFLPVATPCRAQPCLVVFIVRIAKPRGGEGARTRQGQARAPAGFPRHLRCCWESRSSRARGARRVTEGPAEPRPSPDLTFSGLRPDSSRETARRAPAAPPALSWRGLRPHRVGAARASGPADPRAGQGGAGSAVVRTKAGTGLRYRLGDPARAGLQARRRQVRGKGGPLAGTSSRRRGGGLGLGEREAPLPPERPWWSRTALGRARVSCRVGQHRDQ